MIRKTSSLRIWWECRKLFHLKWFAISIGIFSVSWPVGLVSKKPYLLACLFGVLAFLHASFAASTYAHIFARKAYPLLPNKEIKGLYFSLIEFVMGWLLLGVFYCIFATVFKHSSSIIFQNTCLIGACWVGTWIIWLLCRFSISYASLPVLSVVLIAGENDFFVLLAIIAITWAASVHSSLRKQLGEASDNLFAKLFQSRGSFRVFESFCCGPKLTSITSIRISPSRFLLKVFLTDLAFLFLLIGCMVAAFYIFDLISSRSLHFSFKRLSFIYGYSCVLHLNWKISLFNALENGIPAGMSLSRESWLKNRLKLKRMERTGTVLALLAGPLLVDLGFNYFFNDTWIVSEEYLRSLWGVFIFVPLYFTLSFVLFWEKDLKLFSQNRRGVVLGSPFRQHSTDVRWTAIGITVFYLIFCSAVAIAIAVNDVPLNIFKNPYIWSGIATIYVGYLIWAYRYENKLETRAFREGDLV